MPQEQTEIWVIDSSLRRRSSLASQLGQMGYATYPMDPCDKIPDTFGRGVIAMVYDDAEAINRVLEYRDKLPISCVVYSDNLKAKRAADLIRRGVSELMDWPCQQHEIADAVSEAATGLSNLGSDDRQGASARRRIEALSQREKEVLAWIISGKTSRQIAEVLNLSHRTVEVHRFNCFRQLGVNNAADAIRLGINSGYFKHSVEI